MKRIIIILFAILVCSSAQADAIEELIQMEKRDAARRMNLLESAERDQLTREQRDTLRTQRETNQIQTLRALGGQSPYPSAGGIQPIGLPPLGY